MSVTGPGAPRGGPTTTQWVAVAQALVAVALVAALRPREDVSDMLLALAVTLAIVLPLAEALLALAGRPRGDRADDA